MPATAWRPPRSASCAPSASTSRWAATTTSKPPTRSCCGARTWPRCTRSCGPGSPIAAFPRRMCASPCCRPSSIARSTSPISAWCSSRRPTSICSTPSPTTSSRPAGSTRTSSTGIPCSSAARPTSDTACAPNIRWRKRRPGAPRPATPPTSAMTNTSSSSPTTRWRRPPRCRACRRTGSRRWPNSMPTRRSRSPVSGPWDSTSTPAASGATTSSTTSIC